MGLYIGQIWLWVATHSLPQVAACNVWSCRQRQPGNCTEWHHVWFIAGRKEQPGGWAGSSGRALPLLESWGTGRCHSFQSLDPCPPCPCLARCFPGLCRVLPLVQRSSLSTNICRGFSSSTSKALILPGKKDGPSMITTASLATLSQTPDFLMATFSPSKASLVMLPSGWQDLHCLSLSGPAWLIWGWDSLYCCQYRNASYCYCYGKHRVGMANYFFR